MDEQAPDLVAGKHVKRPILFAHRYAKPVGIRIRCKDGIGANAVRKRKRQRERIRILRVRRFYGWKRGIGLLLFRHDVHRNAHAGKERPHRHATRSMQRRINELQFPAMRAHERRILQQRLRCRIIRFIHLLANPYKKALRKRCFFRHALYCKIIRRAYFCIDCLRLVRCSLAAMLPINFIAVILWRIVACCDHNACNTV